MKSFSIVYLPGYGGNFLRSIFSLDACTVPCVKEQLLTDTPDIRANLYTGNNKISAQHLGDIIDQNPGMEPNFAQYNVSINAMHPHEFSTLDRTQETQIFSVHLDWSNFSNYWLIQSKIDFDYQLARLRQDEIYKHLQLYQRSDVYHIDLNAMLDPKRWIIEYKRINSIMELPDHLSSAQKVYDFWYDLRVDEHVRKFANLAHENHAFFCRERLQEEMWGTPTQWRIFYERVRDPSWPDCKDETDFYTLPDWIQQELITVFNYQPPKPS